MPVDPNERFLKLLLRHQPDLKAFIASLVRERGTVEDLYQEVCLALWQSFGNYDASRPFGAWARGIAAKKVLQARDRSRKAPRTFSPETIEAVSRAYDRTEPGPSEDEERLRGCIQELPDPSRHLLALRYEQSLKLGEIARRMNRTLDAVHKLLCRIRTTVQECIERKLTSR